LPGWHPSLAPLGTVLGLLVWRAIVWLPAPRSRPGRTLSPLSPTRTLPPPPTTLRTTSERKSKKIRNLLGNLC